MPMLTLSPSSCFPPPSMSSLLLHTPGVNMRSPFPCLANTTCAIIDSSQPLQSSNPHRQSHPTLASPSPAALQILTSWSSNMALVVEITSPRRTPLSWPRDWPITPKEASRVASLSQTLLARSTWQRGSSCSSQRAASRQSRLMRLQERFPQPSDPTQPSSESS